MSEEPAPSAPEEPAPPGSGMDRRTRGADRRGTERRQRAQSVPVERRKGGERRTGPRRGKRSINQYDLEADVLEFINAINRFKARSGRAFPTWSEVLGILRDLGYQKPS